MQLDISDEAAFHLQTKARQAGFESVEAYLLRLVNDQDASLEEPPAMPYEQWKKKYWAFVAHQKSRNPNFDDSRESIYLGP
jgi:hypothetical protein